MRSPGGRQTARGKSQRLVCRKSEDTQSLLELRERKLRRLFFVAHETARTIAALAFAGGPR